MEKIVDLGHYVAVLVNWMTTHLKPLFDFIKDNGNIVVDSVEWAFLSTPFYVVIAIFSLIAWRAAGKGLALFTLLGLILVDLMGLWIPTMQTLALILVSTVIALIIAIPLGIWGAKNTTAHKIIRPILDFMQTMPAFVYLIPAVLFFSIGKLPGAFATIIFAMPPAVRLTTLGINQVPEDIIEAAESMGATSKQILFKIELPLAMKTILTGVNQTILLALSMVVIAGMIAAGGLGEKVLEAINNLDIGLGFESGLSVVILAIILDRITQSLGKKSRR